MLWFDPKMKAVARFLATAFLLFIAWFIVHDFLLLKHTRIVQDLIANETELSVNILNAVQKSDVYIADKSSILHNGKKALRVGEECSALVLFALFAGFIICFPGEWRYKWWYILLGIFLIFTLNIIRIVALTINYIHFRSSFAFNHHVTFTYFIYGVIFAMWIFWVNKFSKIRT